MTPKRPVVVALAGAVVVVIAFGVAAVTGGARATEPSRRDVPQLVGGAIQVSAAFRDAAGIATTIAVRAPLAPHVKVVGEAAFDPNKVSSVGPRAPGIVTRVHRVVGDTIRKGDILASIDSPTLAEAQADLRVARARKDAARLNADRERKLLERQLTTAREYEEASAGLQQEEALELAATEKVRAHGGAGQMSLSLLRAPTSGVVAERAVNPGQHVASDLVAFRIGDLDDLWVLLRLFERHVSVVRAGDAVDIRLLSDRARVIHGTVAHVGSVLDETTRTTDGRVIVKNEARVLRPGQAVEATIRAGGVARIALVVPSSAVTFVDGAPTVFVAETDSRFVARRVELGLDGGDVVEVTSGVEEGEVVVSRSVLALKSELFR